MIEALWSVEFGSNVQMQGAGVAVFETGRILGGDAGYYYVGSYKIKDSAITADIKVVNYRGQSTSIFGPIPEFNLSVSGTVRNPTFEVEGQMVENPAMRIRIRLTRRAELP